MLIRMKFHEKPRDKVTFRKAADLARLAPDDPEALDADGKPEAQCQAFI